MNYDSFLVHTNTFLIKIVPTFAPVMMKYLLCIWFGMLLTLGIDSTSDQSLQNFQTKTGTAEMQSYFTSADDGSSTIIRQSDEEVDTDRGGQLNYTISNGVCGTCFLSRSLPSEKHVRPHFTSFVAQRLNASKPQLPEERWIDFSLSTNLCKYSNNYYIYALKRILI